MSTLEIIARWNWSHNAKRHGRCGINQILPCVQKCINPIVRRECKPNWAGDTAFPMVVVMEVPGVKVCNMSFFLTFNEVGIQKNALKAMKMVVNKANSRKR